VIFSAHKILKKWLSSALKNSFHSWK